MVMSSGRYVWFYTLRCFAPRNIATGIEKFPKDLFIVSDTSGKIRKKILKYMNISKSMTGYNTYSLLRTDSKIPIIKKKIEPQEIDMVNPLFIPDV